MSVHFFPLLSLPAPNQGLETRIYLGRLSCSYNPFLGSHSTFSFEFWFSLVFQVSHLQTS